MTADYFEAKKTGGGKESIEITVEVKNDKVIDFANEIASEVKDATIDRVLEIIDKKHNDIQNHDWYTDHPTAADRMKLLRELRKEIEYEVRANDKRRSKRHS